MIFGLGQEPQQPVDFVSGVLAKLADRPEKLLWGNVGWEVERICRRVCGWRAMHAVSLGQGFPSGWLRLGLSRCYEHGGGPLVFQARIAYCINMKEAIRKTVGGKRRGPGRPATGAAPSRTFRLTDEFIASLDAWAASQVDKPSRSEAIRRLVELGMRAKK